jgi:threonine dehydrogenase-like Zn-dependent dehydrogenase
MKALLASAPGKLELVDRPVPAPQPDEVLVRVTTAAICHTDSVIRQGLAHHVTYPVVIGHEFSGVVEACGTLATHVSRGDRVAVDSVVSCGQCRPCRLGQTVHCVDIRGVGSGIDGGFAEYVSVPERNLHRIPDDLSLEVAAMAEPAANAYSAVRRGGILQGERVVVLGPGPIGLLAIQIARLYHPSELVLVGTRDERLSVGARLGASRAINIRRAGAEEELIEDILCDRGADVVIECAGTRDAVDLAFRMAGPNGRIAVEGLPRIGDIMQLRLHDVHRKALTIAAVNGYLTPDFVYALDLLSEGFIQVDPLITHHFSLDQWESAFRMIEEHKSEAIKVVFSSFAQ